MNQWDVWFADFPYEEDASIIKPRPVIILDINPLKVLSVKVTHHGARDCDPYDMPIEHWRESGLDQPSVARVSKAIYLTGDKFVRCLGQLLDDDIEKIYYKYIEYVKSDHT